MKTEYEKPEIIDFESNGPEFVAGASAATCVSPCTVIPSGGLRSMPKSSILLLDANGNPVVLKK